MRSTTRSSTSLRSLSSKSIRTFIAILFILGIFLSDIGSALPLIHAESLASAAVVDSFESTANLAPSLAKANSVKLDVASRPEPIPYGYHALKLIYDFTATIGTSAAYINFKDPGGLSGRTLQGYPKKIGVWVYGDGNSHWLRAQLQDAAGAKPPLDFTSSSGLNWTGWKYVTAAVPGNLQAPIKLNQIYVAETKDSNKNSGTIYFDQLSAFYTDSTIYGLDLVGLTPMQTGAVKQANVYATYLNSTEPQLLNSGVTFQSSDSQVAMVDASGSVTALKAGTALITANYGNGPQAVYSLTVSNEAPVPQRLELQALNKLEAGTISKVRVFAAYSGSPDPAVILSGAAFTSSSPAIATVSADGEINAIKAGSTAVSVTYGGQSAQYTLTVTNPVPVLQRIALDGLSAMTVGETKPAKVFGFYTLLPDPVELSSGVAFTSSSPDVASVSANGLVTALKVGTSRILASYGGKTSDFYMVVNKPAVEPKQEMRAAWIATVDNVDWPQKGVVNGDQQKQDYIHMLDELQAAGINAVIFQVKPTADSFYPSQYGPWSEWLTGVQGKDPGYNPLAFVLEEAHKRNMEFHAWFNPYRISIQDNPDKLVADHPARLHPDWVVSYGGKLYFDPGNPEAKAFIMDSMMEVVKNYDIDAVHFDDYFYPYPVTGVDFPDSGTFSKYGTGFANKADWRRNNVNTFIQEIGVKIKLEKSYVKFGISPFGIWRNKAQDPAGSDTNGLSSYEAIYADTRKWVDAGWIDYITPQIYWYMGYSPAAYDKLIEWWGNLVKGKNVHLYSGQAVYRIGASDPAWLNPDEMPNQIVYNRNFDSVRGSMFFSAKSILNNPLGFTDRLQNELYKHPALVPTMPWLDNQAPAPTELQAALRKKAGVELVWQDAQPTDASYYVVYRFNEGETVRSTSTSHIVGKVRKQPAPMMKFVDLSAVDGLTYTYAVTAVDRLHNESGVSNVITMKNELDITAPVTTAVFTEGQPNSSGWANVNVTVTLNPTDTGSGVALTFFTVDNGSEQTGTQISVTEEGMHTVSYWSEDFTGNVEPKNTLSFGIDKTPPVITGSPTPANDSGWNNTDVAVDYACSDALAGIAACQPQFTLMTEGAGQSITGTALDKAGNSASVVLTVNLDKTAPSVTYSVYTGAVYTVDQFVNISCQAEDSLSGIVSSTCENISSPAYSFGLGSHTYSATATDLAGNTGTGSTEFSITVTIDSLIRLLQQFLEDRGIDHGVGHSLVVKLNNAMEAKDDSQRNRALKAFQNEVSAQSGKALTTKQAEVVQRLVDALTK